MSASPCPEGLAEILRQLVALGEIRAEDAHPTPRDSLPPEQFEEPDGSEKEAESNRGSSGIS